MATTTTFRLFVSHFCIDTTTTSSLCVAHNDVVLDLIEVLPIINQPGRISQNIAVIDVVTTTKGGGRFVKKSLLEKKRGVLQTIYIKKMSNNITMMYKGIVIDAYNAPSFTKDRIVIDAYNTRSFTKDKRIYTLRRFINMHVDRIRTLNAQFQRILEETKLKTLRVF